jgi:YebC/PmpR family DNA-binding regulatory protein
MSGHSKWATIKRKKGAKDQQRGKLFSKLIKEITIAARHGGGDMAGNARLRAAVDAAKAENMPAVNIERAIKRGTGEIEGVTYEETHYEGYGPAGVAVLVEVATDNRNRTVSEIRHIFSKQGGNLGELGCVAWMFARKSQILIDQPKATEEQLMDVVLDAGADDLRGDGTHWEVLSPPDVHDAVLEAIHKAGIETASAQIAMIPTNMIKLEGKNAAGMLRLAEALEEHDDVQNVYSNFDIDEKEMEALAG